MVRIKLFAVAKEYAGGDTLSLELPEQATVADVRRELVARIPQLVEMQSRLMIAVDMQYADDQTPVGPEADIACIPPVSGG